MSKGILSHCVCVVGLLWSMSTAQGSGVVYFAEVFNPTFSDGSIKRINTDGTGLETLVCTGGGLRGLAIDLIARNLYWTDVDHDVIRRANLNGTMPEDLVTTGLAFPMSIDLDLTEGSLYWGDQSLDQIGRADLDGSNASVILRTAFTSGLTVDPWNGKLTWSTAISGPDGNIMRSNLDGSDVETVVTGVGKPREIALDIAGGAMYWTDYAYGTVRRSNLDGTGVEDLFVADGDLGANGIALDLADGKVYWGQETYINAMNIMRMNLDGSKPEIVAEGFGHVTEIVFVPEVPFTCTGDINGDGMVGVVDLLLLLSEWGACASCPAGTLLCPADFDGSGDVGVKDLLILLGNWGPCP